MRRHFASRPAGTPARLVAYGPSRCFTPTTRRRACHYHRCLILVSEVLGPESDRMHVTWRSVGKFSGQVLGVTQPILPVLAHLAANRCLQFVR